MFHNSRYLGWLSLGLMIFLIFLDQITKIWANQAGLVSLNQGVSFGMSLPPMLVLLLSIGLLMGVGWGWWQAVSLDKGDRTEVKTQSSQVLWYSLILAGGLSNLIDRIVWGGVRDWLPIPLTPLHNNLADWLIVIGCMGLVWLLIQKPRLSN